jgi:hypothetical protein
MNPKEPMRFVSTVVTTEINKLLTRPNQQMKKGQGAKKTLLVLFL